MGSDQTLPILPSMALMLIIYAIGATSRRRATQQLEKARLEYQEALHNLKANPTNPDLKQKTLQLGRVYSNLTRNKQGVTLFDELALMNDINAVTAGATSRATAPISGTTTASLEARLAELSDLKARGKIDEAEYVAARKKLIDKYVG